jgi:hypothetical protein
MRKRPQQPPSVGPIRPIEASTPGLLELDRFSTASLARWRHVSADLDEINDLLYFGIEPQRKRHRDEMLAALRSAPPLTFQFFLAGHA